MLISRSVFCNTLTICKVDGKVLCRTDRDRFTELARGNAISMNLLVTRQNESLIFVSNVFDNSHLFVIEVGMLGIMAAHHTNP